MAQFAVRCALKSSPRYCIHSHRRTAGNFFFVLKDEDCYPYFGVSYHFLFFLNVLGRSATGKHCAGDAFIPFVVLCLLYFPLPSSNCITVLVTDCKQTDCASQGVSIILFFSRAGECVRGFAFCTLRPLRIHTHAHTHIYIHIYKHSHSLTFAFGPPLLPPPPHGHGASWSGSGEANTFESALLAIYLAVSHCIVSDVRYHIRRLQISKN